MIELKLQPAKCELLAQINSYNLKENILLYFELLVLLEYYTSMDFYMASHVNNVC